MNTSQHRVIFIDGVCVLCNRLSRIYAIDLKTVFILNSRFFCQKTTLRNKGRLNRGSQDEMIYTKSKAILFIIHTSKGTLIAILLKIIPSFSLDYAYDRVAKIDTNGLERQLLPFSH